MSDNSKTLVVRISPEELDALKSLAAADERSVSAYMRLMIRRAVQAHNYVKPTAQITSTEVLDHLFDDDAA